MADPGFLQLDARVLVLLDDGSLPSGLPLLRLVQQPTVFRIHQDFDFMLCACEMHASVYVQGTRFAPN